MGFIGIDRGIEDHWIYQDAEYFKVWFEILLRARYSNEPEKKLIEGKLVNIEFGQFIFGRISWSERLKVSEKRLRTLFEKLIQDDMIQLIARHPRFTVYNVVNLAKYRPNLDHQEGQQNGQLQIQSGQAFEEYEGQQNGDERANKGPAGGQQGATQEQGKQRKQSKQGINKVHYAEFVQLTEEEYSKLVDVYGEEMTKECIEILNTYKGSTGKKYKSDYMTMTPTSWVPKRYHEDQERKLKVVTGGQYRERPSAINKIQEMYKKALEDEQREANGGY